MNSHELKQHKSDVLAAFLEAIKVKVTDPRDFLVTYADLHPKRVSPFGRHFYFEAMEVFLRGHMRTKAGDYHCDQMSLWPDLFEDGPVGIPVKEGGYIGAGKATVAHWEYVKNDHLSQADGHLKSAAWIDNHIARRRALGMPDDVAFYDWRKGQPKDGEGT
jgi:hypothetical protein